MVVLLDCVGKISTKKFVLSRPQKNGFKNILSLVPITTTKPQKTGLVKSVQDTIMLEMGGVPKNKTSRFGFYMLNPFRNW